MLARRSRDIKPDSCADLLVSATLTDTPARFSIAAHAAPANVLPSTMTAGDETCVDVLAVTESRGPFLSERGHSFFLIAGGEGIGKGMKLGIEP